MKSETAASRAASGFAGMSRRTALGALSGSLVAGGLLPLTRDARADELKGRIKQSVCLWCYNGYLKRENMNLDDFSAFCAKLGLKSIELTSPGQWPTLKEHGLICAMTPSHGITKGLNRTENHEECLEQIRKSIDETAAAGFPNVICFSGNREGMDDQVGLANCVTALKSIAPYAEEKKVTICMEFLNSINHADYMADTTAWCVQLVEKVGSSRVKVLYDIYHAAMMKEDVLADIQKHHACWGHYHTGGYPGRNEIDDSQELNYAELMQAIVESGYTGYVGQEFVPKRPEALESLKQAVALCDV